MRLTGIRPGDVVLVDGPSARGGEPAAAVRRYYAEVRQVEPAAGGGELRIRRSEADPTFPVRAGLVIKHFRQAGRPRVAKRRGEIQEAVLT